MVNLTQIAKFSAKKIFQDIQQQSGENPFLSQSLCAEVKITKLFFQHVVYKKRCIREYREIIERILIMPFVENIIRTGTLSLKRVEQNIEFYELSKKIKKWEFSVVIQKKTQQKDFSLLRCFRKYTKKKTLS